MGLERWISAGDTFTGWTGDEGNIVVSAPDETGHFYAQDVNGCEEEWHVAAIKPGTIRRPVATWCPEWCPRCGLDLRDAGYPAQHQWEGCGDTCPFTWKPPTLKIMGNDIQAWIETADDLGLTKIVEPRGLSVVIFNREHPGRGWLWVQEGRLITAYSMDETGHDIDAGTALVRLGSLSRRVVHPIK